MRKRRGLAATSTVNLAGAAVTCPCHVCAFYSSAEEQAGVLLPFLKEGLAAGDRAMAVGNANERDQWLDRLRQCGVDIAAAQRDGRLQIEIWEDVYLPRGRFDADEMIGFAQDSINTGLQRGFARTRGWADMAWALADVPGVERLALYESRLNFFLPLYNDAMVCAYDVTRFPVSVLDDVARAHPYLLIDGLVHQSLNYVPPEKLVPEFEARRS